MSKVSEQDKQKVLDWMTRYALGFRRARTRANILPYLPEFTDRAWRSVISELKHDGLVASTCFLGYWAIIPDTKDKAEAGAVLESYQEMHSKAMALLTDTSRFIKHWQDRKLALTQQMEIFS